MRYGFYSTNFRENHPDLATLPDDGFIPCLFSAFREVTEEIKVLFDPENEYSLVVPRYPFLKKTIQKINDDLDYDTYREDEFLGWVYQYFNSREKDRVFEEVRTKKKKIAGSDIINVTQLYTEKYMVRFLVENSLGAMWMEMYPDSQLCNKWEYFVKDPNNSTREPKPVQEITFLDPACGSGHFLLYAFDLYYDMYLEEGTILDNQIPEFILRHNLHGIDIDLRAIQLSALGLFMKAKSMQPDMKVQHMNLVSADAIMLDSEILEEFLEEFRDDPTAQELIETIWQGLENVRELGSLLKVEEQIDEVIERQKSWGSQKSLDARDWKDKGWEQWKRDLLAKLKGYYEKAAQTFDINRQMFANEACKGVQLLDLLEQRYDVVATNPPYLGHKNFTDNLKISLDDLYEKNSSDLYQCFIIRCIELNNSNGFFSMICQKSFIFLNTFVKTRELILKTDQIRTLILLGPGAFEDISGEVVNTTMFSLKKVIDNKFDSIFFDVSNELSKASKIKEYIQKNKIYRVNQINFNLISDSPFVFWMRDFDKLIFENYKPIDDKTKNSFAAARQGLITGNNDRFLRYIWEINDNETWMPYMKGGVPNKWYGNQLYVVNWYNNGEKIKQYVNEKGKLLSRPQNISFYLKEGITYSTTSNNFAARYMPKGFIFDAKASAIFPITYKNVFYMLGLFNSNIAIHLLNLLSPALDFNVGYTQKIPFKVPEKETEKNVEKYVDSCITIKKSQLMFSINDRGFKQTAIQWGYNKLEKK